MNGEFPVDPSTPGAVIRCGGCMEVVYPDCKILQNHTIIRHDDGRIRWISRDMGCVVHQCDPACSVVAQAEAIIMEAPAS